MPTLPLHFTSCATPSSCLISAVSGSLPSNRGNPDEWTAGRTEAPVRAEGAFTSMCPRARAGVEARVAAAVAGPSPEQPPPPCSLTRPQVPAASSHQALDPRCLGLDGSLTLTHPTMRLTTKTHGSLNMCRGSCKRWCLQRT